jgi:hypothetical protein
MLIPYKIWDMSEENICIWLMDNDIDYCMYTELQSPPIIVKGLNLAMWPWYGIHLEFGDNDTAMLFKLTWI